MAAPQDVVLLIGDSLVDYLATIPNNTSTSDASDYNRAAYPGATWFSVQSIAEHSWFPYLADAWFTGRGRTLGAINAGISGTKLIGNWDAAGAGRTNAQNYWSDVGSPTVSAVYCILGANDVISGATVSTATYETGIASVKTWVTANFTGSPQLYFGIFSDASASGDTTRMNRFRQAVKNQAAISVCAIGANLTGQTYAADDVHPETTAQAQEIGRGFYAATFGIAAPAVSTITYEAATKKVRVTFDKDLSNALSSSVGGFRVMDNGVSVTVNSAVVSSTRMVTLTLQNAIAGTCTAGFAHGREAVGQTVPRGVSQQSGGLFMSAVPFFDAATTTYSSSPGMGWVRF